MKTAPLKSADINIMKPGIYIAGINEDITTYDIRMKEPNKEPVLTNSALHTLEHIINDYLSKTEFSDNIIHFAPMASRTGFFLITKNERNIEIAKNMLNEDINLSAIVKCTGLTEEEINSLK